MKLDESLLNSVLLFIGVVCLFALLVGLPVWILWNLVMPDVFGLPYITFWQAVGIQLIASLLFKDFRKASSN